MTALTYIFVRLARSRDLTGSIHRRRTSTSSGLRLSDTGVWSHCCHSFRTSFHHGSPLLCSIATSPYPGHHSSIAHLPMYSHQSYGEHHSSAWKIRDRQVWLCYAPCSGVHYKPRTTTSSTLPDRERRSQRRCTMLLSHCSLRETLMVGEEHKVGINSRLERCIALLIHPRWQISRAAVIQEHTARSDCIVFE